MTRMSEQFAKAYEKQLLACMHTLLKPDVLPDKSVAMLAPCIPGLFACSVHYHRIPPVYWKDRLLRVRSMGLNTIEVDRLTFHLCSCIALPAAVHAMSCHARCYAKMMSNA